VNPFLAGFSHQVRPNQLLSGLLPVRKNIDYKLKPSFLVLDLLFCLSAGWINVPSLVPNHFYLFTKDVQALLIHFDLPGGYMIVMASNE
jgi:hypothetical protein